MTAGYSEPPPDNTPDNAPEPIIPEPLASTVDNQINNMWLTASHSPSRH